MHRLAQIVTRGGEKARLVLACFRKLPAFFLDFVEQADVFDGDHRLVGKSGDQLDLLISKRLHDTSGQDQRADRNALPEERDSKGRTYVCEARTCKPGALGQAVLWIGLNISNLN